MKPNIYLYKCFFYSKLCWGEGGIFSHILVLPYSLVDFCLFILTKAVSNKDIVFMKAVLLLWEHRHFSPIFVSHGSICPLPPPTKLGPKRKVRLYLAYTFILDTDDIQLQKYLLVLLYSRSSRFRKALYTNLDGKYLVKWMNKMMDYANI